VHIALLITAAIFGNACGAPRIVEFDVQPRTVCAGERAVVRWSAHGDTAMTLQLEVRLAGKPDAEPVPEILKLRLVARKSNKEVVADQELIQLPPTSVRGLALPTRIEGKAVIASGSTDAAVWNERVQVLTVAASNHRAVEVRHAGKAASLGSEGVASEALRGTPFCGWWDLRSALTDAELKDPSIRPTDLEIQVTVVCKPEKP